MDQTKNESSEICRVVWGGEIEFVSEKDLVLWSNTPITISTNYVYQSSLIGILLNEELIKNKIMLINNLFSSITGPKTLKLNLCNLNERSFTLKRGQIIGMIVPIGR
jgi:hypothetical protein